MIPDYGVNERGSGDMYYRGSNFLHTLRAVVDDDSLWRSMLLGLNRLFYHRTVGTVALVAYMEKVLGLDVAPLAAQYLMDTRLPVLEFGFRDGHLRYRYARVRSDFAMPVDIKVEIWHDGIGESGVVSDLRLVPRTSWQSLDLSEVMDLGMAGLAMVAADNVLILWISFQWGIAG